MALSSQIMHIMDGDEDDVGVDEHELLPLDIDVKLIVPPFGLLLLLPFELFAILMAIELSPRLMIPPLEPLPVGPAEHMMAAVELGGDDEEGSEMGSVVEGEDVDDKPIWDADDVRWWSGEPVIPGPLSLEPSRFSRFPL